MQKVKSKNIEESFEAGGGDLFIPILGNLFPKLFDHKPKSKIKYLIYTEEYRYEVEEKDYKKLKIGDRFDERMSVFH